ncbi:hypothetical protein ALC57_04355 [Trachymyrmex cornetzi]|uniref:Uncharacterized protein n=1 Tax=Trachymyrmex cornetzi TaxID=471704 RepID=A0A151JCD3_9HYME|nr:hypothetical protein ALC57_04355 [Trachymyrmex cornetzi]
MKWLVKKLCGSPSQTRNERRRRDAKIRRDCGMRNVAPRLGGRGNEVAREVVRRMREKKMSTMELAQSKDRRSPLIRVSHPLLHFARATHERAGWLIIAYAIPMQCYRNGGDESRKATCEAVVTLASEIGNCPTNGITNACALAPDGK